MQTADVVQCSFPSWYNKFKDVTEKSVIIPLPESFITYLHTDGLVLPESSTHGVYGKASNLAMGGDEDDEDLRDEDLLKQYEDDWSTPDAGDASQAPDFGEFDKKVEAGIKSLDGRVFPKLNWSSPKDATWISFDKSLLCICPSDVYLLLKSSEFVAHDLDHPFTDCVKDTEAAEAPSVQYVLVLRKWKPPDPSTEFRGFVYGKKLIGISQREQTKYYPHILAWKEGIAEDITHFFNKTIQPRFPLHNYVFDVVRSKKHHVELVDFNPFGPVTDSLMFTWEELDKLATSAATEGEFRCVENEDGVKLSEYANYAIPRDIQDLTAGEDPYKMMDLLKLREGQMSDSSSEDESDARNSEKSTSAEKKTVNQTDRENQEQR